MPEVNIGRYYERPDGVIVYILGYNSSTNLVMCREEGELTDNVMKRIFDTWIIRKDLKDYPNSKDPILPYVFDLFWDIKRISELKQLIQAGGEEIEEIKRIMKEENIKLDSK